MLIYTFFFGKIVGKDKFGNRYYTNKKDKRWVIYNGIKETTKIPPEWHIWIHHIVNEIPINTGKCSWHKEYEPNFTGTKYAYYPNKN